MFEHRYVRTAQANSQDYSRVSRSLFFWYLDNIYAELHAHLRVCWGTVVAIRIIRSPDSEYIDGFRHIRPR